MGHKIAPGRKPHPKIAVYRNLRSRIRIMGFPVRAQACVVYGLLIALVARGVHEDP